MKRSIAVLRQKLSISFVGDAVSRAGMRRGSDRQSLCVNVCGCLNDELFQSRLMRMNIAVINRKYSNKYWTLDILLSRHIAILIKCRP
jgi:hypothetical protein